MTVSVFGQELRRRRNAAGLSLRRLAERVHFSAGQLCKVENGTRHPTRELARLCDAALKAEGALVQLAPRPDIGNTKDLVITRH